MCAQHGTVTVLHGTPVVLLKRRRVRDHRMPTEQFLEDGQVVLSQRAVSRVPFQGRGRCGEAAHAAACCGPMLCGRTVEVEAAGGSGPTASTVKA